MNSGWKGIPGGDAVEELIAGAELIPRLGPSHGQDDGNPIPDGIDGARIVRFGTIRYDAFPEWLSPVAAAAIVIDYVPANCNRIRRVAIGANDFGASVRWLGEAPSSQVLRPTPAQDSR
jgi:hypothetical protein